jgi:hypothetical protein
LGDQDSIHLLDLVVLLTVVEKEAAKNVILLERERAHRRVFLGLGMIRLVVRDPGHFLGHFYFD